MKLVIKQYLESLKERGELDAVLPDLLSQMGLEVFLKPGIGARQFGVDVAAVGSIEGGEKKVYLFSIKSGDLGRKDWDSGGLQDLRPSINEIIDVFIPTRIPPEHKSKKIEICLCFGGEIKEEVRPNVTSFTESHTNKTVSFSEWNGDKLSGFIESYFLREELLPTESRSLLRKSLAMIDEPTVSFKNFSALVALLCEGNTRTPKETLTIIRQLYICTWILFAWCREADNLESSYQASELVILRSWDICRSYLGKRDKSSKAIFNALDAIFNLYIIISSYYLKSKIIPFVDKLHALSSAVSSSTPVDINLKLYDVLGRLALAGIWHFWLFNKLSDDQLEQKEIFRNSVYEYQDAIKQLIINNPILFSPYKDEQAIEIALAVLLLSIDRRNDNDIKALLTNISESIYNQFVLNGSYPANIYTYSELIEHPIDNSDEYRKSVTKGSILYPYISIFSAIFNASEAYDSIKKLREEFLKHCNFQIFFLDESSEEHLYSFSKMHGATLSDVDVNQEHSDLLKDIANECEQSDYFRKLSAIKYDLWPLILVSSRHFRLPVPIHFMMDLYGKGPEG